MKYKQQRTASIEWYQQQNRSKSFLQNTDRYFGVQRFQLHRSPLVRRWSVVIHCCNRRYRLPQNHILLARARTGFRDTLVCVCVTVFVRCGAKYCSCPRTTYYIIIFCLYCSVVLCNTIKKKKNRIFIF